MFSSKKKKKKIIYAYKGYIYTNLVTMEPSSLRQRIDVMLKEATWKGQKNQQSIEEVIKKKKKIYYAHNMHDF